VNSDKNQRAPITLAASGTGTAVPVSALSVLPVRPNRGFCGGDDDLCSDELGRRDDGVPQRSNSETWLAITGGGSGTNVGRSRWHMMRAARRHARAWLW